ncbi:hypothetical protein BDN72DRAFT_333355 [Pluteus cervinus]|uniref:Uncharacterized protein n=1 Tax=Pluteus cervinus TaxID=181527 RepID=A0ACD3ABV8_9AGAR|nr:hypothetical protein BDN72DRAFT_333355 [Pluteus cervinus]
MHVHMQPWCCHFGASSLSHEPPESPLFSLKAVRITKGISGSLRELTRRSNKKMLIGPAPSFRFVATSDYNDPNGPPVLEITVWGPFEAPKLSPCFTPTLLPVGYTTFPFDCPTGWRFLFSAHVLSANTCRCNNRPHKRGNVDRHKQQLAYPWHLSFAATQRPTGLA